MDWADRRRTDRIIVQRVNPANLDAPMGELDGVVLSGSSIEAAYYSDTRVSARLNIRGAAWTPGEYVRIIHQVPEHGYAKELGTFIVTDRSGERSRGQWESPLNLQSMLYGLSLDALPRPWTVAANAMASKAMAQIMAQSVHSYLDSARDYKLKSPRVIDAGTTRLAAMFALAQLRGARLDVDGHGRITAEDYVAPRSKAPAWRLELGGPRGIVEDGVSFSSNLLEIADTVAVSYQYSANGRDRRIDATAKAGPDSPVYAEARGYRVVDFRDLSEMTPATAARAAELAASYLEADSAERIEWEIKCAYVPVWPGDVVEIAVPDGPYPGVRKALVKSAGIDLDKMSMSLTLKETNGEDVD